MSELNTAAAVHIIGTGLLGASIGLGLRADGLDVTLEDLSPTAQSLAADYGAGRPRSADDPDPVLVIVATPPDVTATDTARTALLGKTPEEVGALLGEATPHTGADFSLDPIERMQALQG